MKNFIEVTLKDTGKKLLFPIKRILHVEERNDGMTYIGTFAVPTLLRHSIRDFGLYVTNSYDDIIAQIQKSEV